MKEKVREYNREKDLFHEHDKIIVGVSGGKDSVCLLHVLNELREEYSLSLLVVHINHGIRGEEADADARFVETLAESMELPCHVEKVDVKEVAKVRRVSLEEAGRDERYRIMEMLRVEHDFHKIAIAHHQDDVAETVLFNLLRGTGPRGLSGIAAKRDYIIRPLLFAPSEDVEGYIKANKLEFRSDCTNEEEIYIRNILRLSVFPLLEEKINARAKSHVADAAYRIALQNEYIEKEAKKAYLRVVRMEEGEYNYEVKEFTKLDKAIQTEVIRLILSNLIPNAKDIDHSHYHMLNQLLNKEVGKQTNLPEGIVVQRTYKTIRYFVPEEEREEKQVLDIKCIPPCEQHFVLAGEKFRLNMEIVTDWSTLGEIPQKDYTKWIDYDRIRSDIFLRTPRKGDYLTLDSKGRRKKLSRYFIDKKVPADQRSNQIIIADGSHILCIMSSGRMSEAYKVTENTKQILIITKRKI